jgi:hypothetical protein
MAKSALLLEHVFWRTVLNGFPPLSSITMVLLEGMLALFLKTR